jgi:DNA-binding transcriptional ArsR family regulator
VTTDLQLLLDAVASPVRREILWLTWADELSVGDIGRHFEVAGPTLSSHLTTLRDAGLVTMRVDGTFRRYRCNQDAVRKLVPLLATNDERWVTADAIPEQALASAERTLAVRAHVDTHVEPAAAFDAFTDGERYSRWLGVPVRIRDGRFSATLEWGTHVRGSYEVVSPPDLIAMRWDFDDDAIPLPGRELIAYLRVRPTAEGSRIEVHQLADDAQQAEFLATAWALVLGRFAEAHADGDETARPRRRRAKRRSR